MSGRDSFPTGTASPVALPPIRDLSEERKDDTWISLASSSSGSRVTPLGETSDVAEVRHGSSSFFSWANEQQDILRETTGEDQQEQEQDQQLPQDQQQQKEQQEQRRQQQPHAAEGFRRPHPETSRTSNKPTWTLVEVSHDDDGGGSELHEEQGRGSTNTGTGDRDSGHSTGEEIGQAHAGPAGAWSLSVSHDDGGQSDLLEEESGVNIASGSEERRLPERRGSGQIDGDLGAREVQLGVPVAAVDVVGKLDDISARSTEGKGGDKARRSGARVKQVRFGIGPDYERSGSLGGGVRLQSESVTRKSPARSDGTSSDISEESILFGALRSGRPEEVTAVLESTDEASKAVDLRNPKLVALAAEGGNRQLFATILDAMLERFTAVKVSGVLAEAFNVASIEAGSGNATDDSMAALSILLQHGAKPSPKDLNFLVSSIDSEKLEDCFFDAIACAQNSFVPFLNVSLALEGAIGEATEKYRRVLARLQREMDAILSDTLKSLPQSVSGLTGGMAACAALLEPELVSKSITCGGGEGPLAAALACSHRIVTFATSPLCMNYMFLKFSRGLPGPHDGPRVAMLQRTNLDHREESKRRECLTALGKGSTLGGILGAAGKALCGDDDGLFLLTVWPGVHFITTGIAALPNSYYRVPVMMMVLDAILYAAVVVLFTMYVLLHDEGPLTGAEIGFACYVVAAVTSETREARKGKTGYLLDRWKLPHMMALQLSLLGFVVRALDPENPWGRGIYALGSPLIYWRLLYFAQVLPSQGTTIQVLYGMASELGQFLVVMTVVMLGFSLSFFALFKDAKGQTFRDSLLDVFQAMLGEVGLFDEFVGTQFDVAATVLLVFYLVIMSIMLLNLLIAVMSTAHGKVEELVLIRVARARVYMYYRWVVDHDALPPPLNVVQLVMLLPCRTVDCLCHTDTYPLARRFMGRLMFWLVMGPFAVVVGSLLWLVSIPNAVAVIWGKRSFSMASKTGRTLLCVLWGTVGMPSTLVVSWVAQTTSVLIGRSRQLEGSRSSQPGEATIESMLRGAAGIGMADLRRQLKDPVTKRIDCYANEDGQQLPATVEHVRVLMERLETTTRERIEALENSLENKIDDKLESLLARLSAPPL